MKLLHVTESPEFILDAIRGGRLSYRSEGNSDSYLDSYRRLILGEDDKRWIKDRFKARAVGETKFLRTIPISLFIAAPLKWWVELDTYKVGTVRQSDSLMHRTPKRGKFTAADFDVSDNLATSSDFTALLAMLNQRWDAWCANGARRNDRQSREWTELQDLIPRSFVYTSHWYASYEVLRNVYWQRRHHRMSGQWATFFDQLRPRLLLPALVFDELPYA